MAGFYANRFSVGTVTVGFISSPSPVYLRRPQRRSATHLLKPTLGPCQCTPWLGLERVPFARTYTGEPSQRLIQLGHGDTHDGIYDIFFAKTSSQK